MNSDRIKRTMLANAEEIKRLQGRVNETVKRRDANDREYGLWQQACAEFHMRYNSLAFPGGYDSALERIVGGEKGAVEAALCFLECRPYFFRSGYMYQNILRKVKRAPLSAEQSERLQFLLERIATWRESTHS